MGGLPGWFPVRRALAAPGGGHGNFGHLPTLPLVCFSAPIPPPPFPAGRGGTLGYFMQGAPPLASPGLEPRRHLFALPLWKTQWGACPAGFRFGGRWRHPAGGLPFLPPAYPAFGLLFCPHPPAPLPGGKGENITLFRRGLRPRHPCNRVGNGTGTTICIGCLRGNPMFFHKGKRFWLSMDSAGSQGEGGPGERNFGV